MYIGLALKPIASQISRIIGVFFATWRLYFELEPTGRNTTGRNPPQTVKYVNMFNLQWSNLKLDHCTRSDTFVHQY